MDESKFWNSFDRTMRLLEAIGLILLVIGPILGVLMIFLSDTVMRLAGVAVFLGSGLLALYHFSFAHVMGALRRFCPTEEVADAVEEAPAETIPEPPPLATEA